MANGTVALELALEAFGIGQGDEVVVPARTYVASASCAVLRGAVPVIADVDLDSQCLTADSIEAVLTARTRAVIVVHLGGWPADMDPIMELARRRNLVVIEDCAQAHGAFYKGRPVGSIGHAGAFSFCQDKIITTGGEGGLLALDDEVAWRRAWAFKDIGRSYEAVYERQHPPGFRWLTESFGTNWRMTEMQAAIGRIQLRRLPEWQSARARNASILREALKGLERAPNSAGLAWTMSTRTTAFTLSCDPRTWRPAGVETGYSRRSRGPEFTAVSALARKSISSERSETGGGGLRVAYLPQDCWARRA